jgi:hypothetical protein
VEGAAALIQINKGQIGEVPGVKLRAARTIRKREREAGIALLIAIFVLLLIGVVAIALIVSSGTESALAGNYRSSTDVYYAAVAGLEEARARLRPSDPNSFKKTDPNFLPPLPLPIGTVGYVLNPGPNDVLANMLPTYPDAEYNNEFGAGPTTVTTTSSVWNRNPLNGLPFPPPLYKWVRVNAVSEKSLNLDVDADGLADSTTPLYYDGARLSNNPGVGPQALELTALAVLPNGSQRLLQYLVAPLPLNLSLPAALTLDGNNPNFTASPSPSYWVKGNDQGSVGTCNPTAAAFTALGYTDTSYSPADFEQPGNPQGILSGPSPTPDLRGNYTNYFATSPNIAAVTLSPNLSTVAELNNLVRTIEENADVVVNGSATQTNNSGPMPSAMSATNPMTIVVNGDLTFSGWRSTGYGLLLVTGKFTYDPDASWDGIILLIGQGFMYSHQGSYTNTQIQGAVLIANTTGLPLSSAPDNPIFDFHSTPTSLSNGIYYSSCWIQAAMPTVGYKVLSFHEIPQ